MCVRERERVVCLCARRCVALCIRVYVSSSLYAYRPKTTIVWAIVHCVCVSLSLSHTHCSAMCEVSNLHVFVDQSNWLTNNCACGVSEHTHTCVRAWARARAHLCTHARTDMQMQPHKTGTSLPSRVCACARIFLSSFQIRNFFFSPPVNTAITTCARPRRRRTGTRRRRRFSLFEGPFFISTVP